MPSNQFEEKLAAFEAVIPAPGGYVPCRQLAKISNPQVVQAVIAIAMLAATQTGAHAITVFHDDLEAAMIDAAEAESLTKNARLILERILVVAREHGIEDIVFDTNLEEN